MVVSIVPILFLGIVSMIVSQRISQVRIEKSLGYSCQATSESVTSLFEEFSERLEYFCNDSQVIEAVSSSRFDDDARQLMFQKASLLLAGQNSNFSLHLVSKVNGLSICTKEKSLLYLQEGWGILRALDEQNGAVIYPNRFIDADNSQICATIAHAIEDSTGTVLGYAFIDVPQSSITQLVSSDMNIVMALLDENQYLMIDQIGIGEDSTANFVMGDQRSNVPVSSISGEMRTFKGKEYLISSEFCTNEDFLLLFAVQYGMVSRSNSYIMTITLIMALISILLCLFFSYKLGNGFSKPIASIQQTMEKVQAGDLTARTSVTRSDEIGDISKATNRMVENIEQLFNENLEKQDRLRLAEIKHLQAQINPHFLYNALDSIKYLAKLNENEKVQQAIKLLATLLKTTMSDSKKDETIEDTMKTIQNYLELEQICYPDKFDFTIKTDPEIKECMLPRLIIQPIVENALTHGLYAKAGHGRIDITAAPDGSNIVFTISDDGVGMDPKQIELIEKGNPAESKDSIGLINIKRRIELYFGKNYGLAFFSVPDHGTTVTVTIPKRRSK